MQAETFGEKLMKRTPYGVRLEGLDVVMTIGDKACRMDWRTALQLGHFLFHAGKVAKSQAGEGGFDLIGLARLTDANLDELKAQRNRDRTAVFSKVR